MLVLLPAIVLLPTVPLCGCPSLPMVRRTLTATPCGWGGVAAALQQQRQAAGLLHACEQDGAALRAQQERDRRCGGCKEQGSARAARAGPPTLSSDRRNGDCLGLS